MFWYVRQGHGHRQFHRKTGHELSIETSTASATDMRPKVNHWRSYEFPKWSYGFIIVDRRTNSGWNESCTRRHPRVDRIGDRALFLIWSKTCQSHKNHRRFNTKNDDVPRFDIYRVRQRDSSENFRNWIIQLDTHLVYFLERVKSTKDAPCLHHFP